MRRFLVFLALALALLPVSHSYGFSEKGQDCAKCHTLSKEEASSLMKDLIPNAKILEIVMSPVKGLWEVDLESGGKKGLVYIDFSKRHLVSGGIISIKEKKNLSQERMTEINRVDVSQIPLDDAVVVGSKEAKHKVIVFSDPD